MNKHMSQCSTDEKGVKRVPAVSIMTSYFPVVKFILITI